MQLYLKLLLLESNLEFKLVRVELYELTLNHPYIVNSFNQFQILYNY